MGTTDWLQRFNIKPQYLKKPCLTGCTRGNNWCKIHISIFCKFSGIISLNLQNTAVSKNHILRKRRKTITLCKPRKVSLQIVIEKVTWHIVWCAYVATCWRVEDGFICMCNFMEMAVCCENKNIIPSHRTYVRVRNCLESIIWMFFYQIR